MDFTRKPKIVKEIDTLAERFPHVLLLYKMPPTGDIALSEFEDLAFERLQVLRVLEQTSQMGHKIYSPEWRLAVLGYLRKEGLRRYVRLLESTGCSAADADSQIRREDYISHFILRLAYCRSNDLRMWFIARELELFKMRFLNLSTDGVKLFIKVNDLNYYPISSDEKDQLKSALLQSTVGFSLVAIENSDFYKVPFTEVLDLIRNTSVYVCKGYAYIPMTELVSCVSSWFRSHLIDALDYANKRLPCLDDDRITGLLSTLHASYTGKDYTRNEGADESMTAESIHVFARKSFPLCMRNLYEVIRSTHHLKHFGRLQFGLFLKGIGLSLDEATRYWKSEFCKLIDSDTFNKKYLYNIKHSFGVIGKMTNYTPYGCKKIISSDAGAGDQHGCPFKLWDKETLKDRMLEYGVSGDGVREVVELATKGNFQIACSKYFIFTHGGVEPKQIINHPNQYFEESQEIQSDNKTDGSQSTKKRKYHGMNTSQSSQMPSTPSTSGTTKIEPKVPSAESMFDDDLDLSQIDDAVVDAT